MSRITLTETLRCVSGARCTPIDGEHEVYWVRRYLENQTAWMKAVAGRYEKDYRIFEYRALQSAAVLQAIGVGLPRVDTETRDEWAS